jgi:D-alanine-D-alanine ligase
MALVEEYIVGIELTVGVLGNDEPIVLPPSQCVSSSNFNHEEKFYLALVKINTSSTSNRSNRIAKRWQHRLHQVAQCKGYARIDCLLSRSHQSY